MFKIEITIESIRDYKLKPFPDNIYMFKVNNRSTREKCKICSKFPNVSIVELEHVRVSSDICVSLCISV